MAGNSSPVVDRIRIIPRPNDFLDRNVGSSGEVFYNRETNSLRVYSGKDPGGYELAKTDLSNISNTVFATKANAAGISGGPGGSTAWNDITDKPTFADVATSGDYDDLINTPSIPTTLTDLGIADASNGYVLTTDGAGTFAFLPSSGPGGGEANQNAFSNVSVDGQTTLAADTTTDTLTFVAGTNVSITTDVNSDSITINATSGTFNSLTDIQTANLALDKIYDDAITRYTLDNTGTSAYTFSPHYTGSNPTIYAIAGLTIAFDLSNVLGHPFEIQDALGNPYNTGLVHVTPEGTVSTGADAQGKDRGTLYWYINEADGGTYRYQCQNHAAMVGAINVKRLSLL